jgi:hypothetical protein
MITCVTGAITLPICYLSLKLSKKDIKIYINIDTYAHFPFKRNYPVLQLVHYLVALPRKKNKKI